jgi:hypothetical protein
MWFPSIAVSRSGVAARAATVTLDEGREALVCPWPAAHASAPTRSRSSRRGTPARLKQARRVLWPLLVPELVVTEVSYLLSDRIGPHAELAFARAIAAGELLVEPILDPEWGWPAPAFRSTTSERVVDVVPVT